MKKPCLSRSLEPTDRQTGSAAAEIVILTPLLVLLILVLVMGGRLANASQDLTDAARTSVESAVVASNASAARAQAAATASYEISHDGLECDPYSIVTDVAEFTAGGRVSVRVSCRVKLFTLGLPGLPTALTVSSQASAAIETYREVG
jgi:hypothetical protein